VRRSLRALAAAALLAPALAACAGTAGRDPRTMRFPTEPLAPPQPKRVTLDNGLLLFLLPDPELPLVNVQVLVRTGAVLEPADKVDLADLTGRLMRTGGTAARTGPELSAKLEDMGAVLETAIGSEAGTASLSVLAEDLPVGLGLLAEVLRTPAFDPAEVERVRRRRIEEIRRSNDEPDRIAFREFRTAVYGSDPRGRQPSPEMVAAITREDIAAFHAASFFPDRTILGVSGRFDEGELLELVRKDFGDWRPAGTPAPAFPVPSGEPRAGLFLVRRAVPQATLVLGHLAPAKDSPDYHAFSVMNYILGGAGFSSRLTREIRSNRGLAYSVGSFYRGGIGYGVFLEYSMTRTAEAAEALRLMRGIAERLRGEGATAAELRAAKDGIVNNLIFAVDSSREVVGRKMSYAYDGLPEDFLERSRDAIEAVTLEDVRRVAGRWLHPDEAATVVVGDLDGIGPLEGYGPEHPITLRDYSRDAAAP